MENPRRFEAFGTGRRGLRPAVVALVLAVATLGCVTADVTLNPDCSGTIEYVYPIAADATPASEKAAFSSPHVTVESLTLGSDRKGTLKAKFDDCTKLNTATGFKRVTVTKTREGDEEKLAITLLNTEPKPDLKDQGREGPKITLTLPGKVAEATPKDKVQVADTKVTWRFMLVDYVHNPKLDLSVRYAVAKDAASQDKGKAATPPATAPPAGDAKPKQGK